MLILGFQELHVVIQTLTLLSAAMSVKIAFGAGEVDIFYFPFVTMYLKKKTLVLDKCMTLNIEKV